MSTSNLASNAQVNTLMLPEAWPPAFARTSASSLPPVSNLSRPARIPVVGNHLPRQCGVATFTTDLCDSIAAECGTTGLPVVAINESRSSYPTPRGYEARLPKTTFPPIGQPLNISILAMLT
jgi:hypothetical protein